MTHYLYIKQHNITNLRYFGYTSRKNPFKYHGSGTYWRRHLKKHGMDYRTVDVWGFDTFEECRTFAIRFSYDNDIVDSPEWANLKTEDATTGGILGETSRARIGSANRGRFLGKTYEDIHGPEKAAALRKIRSEKTKGRNNKGSNNPMYGKTHSDELKLRYSKERSGSNHFTFGWKWTTNGVENKKVPPSTELPKGWRYGRVFN